jgi:hypothetical protein
MHASLYAASPKRAAEKLAALVDGHAAAFHPVAGGYVCFLNREDDWEGAIVELYPRHVTIAHDHGRVAFRKLARPAHGAGGHVNIAVPIARKELEKRCDELGLVHSWRDWQSLLEVWLEDDLLVEIVSV